MEIFSALLLLEQVMILQIREGSSMETGAPVLTMEPMWDRFLTGDRITLSCDGGRELRSTTYNWIINETTKEFREKTYIIESVTKEDVGEYRCQYSTSAHKTPYSNSILVRVSSPDSLMSIESEPEALWYAQTLKLSCQFTFRMQEEFIYTFYREGSVVAEIRTRNKSVSFEKERVMCEDAGRYRCQMQFVKYPNGPVYTSAYKYVDVQESPVILQVNPRLQRAGDSIILNCTCAQDHLCGRGQISFHRNETIVSSDSESHNIYHIQQATLMDSGWYRCMVSQNLSTFMSLRVEVTVQNPPRDFALIIGGSAVAAVLLITFLLLFTVCRLRQKEGVQDIANSQPSRDVSGSTSGDIVYSAVQVNREERDHIRARRESREADSHVTYASLMHLERTRDQDVRAGRQEDNGSSIYQNIRRS
ncbi:high affinity immunoglobulin gamma Fc receptor I-like isoform X1 [Chiloscyllium plagiosum]|uniref:high affinity immunoglobulin gamma Fc receptor I-like isoform X1 n=1 Tax=Chiloscyllium plagiosum TaxID=36176 RepID=UPI001CB7D0F8|nr:high affinity immunoglobulin gamma Fc receptor I-like isoform X1 [Chiloscyllium plagiosum]XP_043539745.1 high affinity immunoglobulin gamma Fc receptor I-like isoform X1 [Chiloscyllium plagiosum]XP_043539746.1 high affinity immunoglobulin gamma Fc receptor I-like isoform X1 [Chiloscyllium plagiosum]XP_043539747.1 high affinity immunoglobulin gamma Fc receptor I-like isoform X1 [Chiloscyllium plagiosum]